MQISIQVKPTLDALGNAFKSVNVDSFLRDEINKIAFRVERFSKQLTPVKTGYLRSSIAVGWLIGKIGALVRANANYAIYVHEGTRRMRARPFMEKGADMTKQYIGGDITARVDQEFANAFKKL